MKKVFEQEWFNGVILTIFAIGLAAILIGGILYFIAAQELNRNSAQQIIQNSETVTPESNTEVQGLVAAGIRRDQLLQQQNLSMIIAGAGLVFAGITWVLFDYGRSYRKRQRMKIENTTSMQH